MVIDPSRLIGMAYDFGDRIGRGVYMYRLRIKTSDGKSAEKIEKLVIL